MAGGAIEPGRPIIIFVFVIIIIFVVIIIIIIVVPVGRSRHRGGRLWRGAAAALSTDKRKLLQTSFVFILLVLCTTIISVFVCAIEARQRHCRRRREGRSRFAASHCHRE